LLVANDRKEKYVNTEDVTDIDKEDENIRKERNTE
jgi:hypothetical protein